MSRSKKDTTNQSEVKPNVELLDLRKALVIFKMENPNKALQLKDIEIIKLYAAKHIPELLASQEKWNDVFRKF